MVVVAVLLLKLGHYSFSAIPVGAIVCYFLYIRNPLSGYLDKRYHKKFREKLLPCIWEFKDEKILVSNKLSKSDISWNAFTKVIIHPTAFFLYPDSGEPSFIRKEYFDDPSEYVELIDKFRAEGCEIKNIS